MTDNMPDSVWVHETLDYVEDHNTGEPGLTEYTRAVSQPADMEKVREALKNIQDHAIHKTSFSAIDRICTAALAILDQQKPATQEMTETGWVVQKQIRKMIEDRKRGAMCWGTELNSQALAIIDEALTMRSATPEMTEAEVSIIAQNVGYDWPGLDWDQRDMLEQFANAIIKAVK